MVQMDSTLASPPNIIDASKYLSLPPTVHESRTQPDAIQLPGYTFLEILEANINKLDKTLKSVDTFIEDLAIHQYQVQELYYPSSTLPGTARLIQETPLDNETFTPINPDNSSALVSTRTDQLPGTTKKNVHSDIPPTPDQSSTSEGVMSVRPLPSEGH